MPDLADVERRIVAQIKRSEKATCRTIQMLLDAYLTQEGKSVPGVPEASSLDALWASNYDNIGSQ